MLKFFADENVNIAIVQGLMRDLPELDIVRVQDIGLEGTSDPDVLEWAANHDRILITHDVRTMIDFAYERIHEGKPMLGVVVVPQSMPIGVAINDLALLAEAGLETDLEGQVKFLPL